MKDKRHNTYFIRAGILLLDNQNAFSSWSMSSIACREGTRTVRFEAADSMGCREAFWLAEGKGSEARLMLGDRQGWRNAWQRRQFTFDVISGTPGRKVLETPFSNPPHSLADASYFLLRLLPFIQLCERCQKANSPDQVTLGVIISHLPFSQNKDSEHGLVHVCTYAENLETPGNLWDKDDGKITGTLSAERLEAWNHTRLLFILTWS